LIYTMIALYCLNCMEIFLLTGNFGGINRLVKILIAIKIAL
jgi:metal-responsive CopG/Arc/MetJ family transcriptional regulator